MDPLIKRELLQLQTGVIKLQITLVACPRFEPAAWLRPVWAEKGSQLDLDELLQGIALRPKEPPPDPTSVRLLTIHAAKGLEFDYVWLMGLAESILPSWQSLKSHAQPAELEEERRNCFVAITRTKKQLTLSHANQYRGWQRQPSRFLAEMNLVSSEPPV